MKLKLLWWLLFISVAISAAWLMFGMPPKPFQAEYVPTEISRGWFTYTDDEMGIEIKYPSNTWSRTQGKGPDGYADVEFIAPNGWRFHIDRHEGAPQSYEYSGWKTKINGFEARWNKYDQRIWASKAVRHEEQCVLQRGNSTYTLNWTRASDDLRENHYGPEPIREFHEMVGTFRFREIKPSDYRRYEDQTYHYSFRYPTIWGWRLNCGGGNADVRDDAKFSLSVKVVGSSTFADEKKLRGDSFAKIGNEQEFFDQKLVGRRLLWNGDNTYAFEKNGNLYLVTIQLKPEFGMEPEQTVTAILNSLRL